MANLLRQEQERISGDCKKNPKLFWQYINKRIKSKTNVSDLKWQTSQGNEMLAQDDKEKAAAFQEFFSSVYTTEMDDAPETGLTKYRKGLQRTTKDRKGPQQRPFIACLMTIIIITWCM